MKFVIDANVLIDMAYAGGLWVLPRLGKLILLDVVLAECLEHPKQPTLAVDVEKAGIKTILVPKSIYEEAEKYKRASLSWPDTIAFYWALKHKAILLTNEKALRRIGQEYKVHCRGTIWVLNEARAKSLACHEDINKWAAVLLDMAEERRLPARELEKFLMPN